MRGKWVRYVAYGESHISREGERRAENGAQEMEAKALLQENIVKELGERYGIVERAIWESSDQVQCQNAFNASAKTTMASLVEEVNTHHGNFQEVVWVLGNNDNHIPDNGFVAQQMTQYIDAQIKDNEKRACGWEARRMKQKPRQRSFSNTDSDNKSLLK